MQVKVGTSIAGYTIVKRLYNRGTKGAVYSAYENQSTEEKDNLAACRVLADHLEWTCILLPRKEGMGMKSADMMRLEDSTVWEIKTNRTGSENSICSSMRRASSQSRRLVMRFDTKAILRRTGRLDIKKAVRTVRRQMKHCGFKKVMLIFGDERPLFLL